MSELVSIIIPTFNRAHLIGQTLDSVKNQVYKNWECIVVDDGSTDYTSELLSFYTESDERFIYIQRPKNYMRGANSCRNLGFQQSRGELINWFDSDDIMHPGKLSTQIPLLLKSGRDMCVCQTMIFEKDLNNPQGLRHPYLLSEDPFNDFICNKIRWLTQAPLIKKSFLLKYNLKFDNHLHQSQEWDFFVRLLNVGAKYCVCSETLVYLRKHSESISYGRMNPKKIMSFFRTRYKVLRSFPDDLSCSAVNTLKSEILWAYINLMQIDAYEQAREVKNYLRSMDKEFPFLFRNFQVELFFYSWKFFGKGEKILKYNRD